MRHPFGFILSLFLIGPSFLFAQQDNFITYTARNGLPVSTIMAIAQDARNYLWIGTEGGGVSCFDGTSFKTFTTRDGLAGNTVRAILEDSQGQLWIGTENGISIYDGYDFLTLREDLDLQGCTVTKLYEDSQHTIWIGTDRGGIKRIPGGFRDSVIVETFSQAEGLTSNFVFDILEDEANRIWLALAGGLDVLIPEKGSFRIQQYTSYISAFSESFTSLARDAKGSVLAGTRNSGLLKIHLNEDQDSFQTEIFDESTGLSDNQIWDLTMTPKGDIWVATDEGGINVLSEQGIQHFGVEQGLPSEEIYRLFLDREDNIWIGTYGQGLSRFLGYHFSHFDFDEKGRGTNISAIAEDKDHHLWLGTYGKGLIKMIPAGSMPRYEIYTTENGLLENDISSVAVDPGGDIWFSYASKGIARKSPGGIRNYTEEDRRIISNSVNCLMVDSEEYLWIGTNLGITVYSGGEPFTDIDASMGLPGNKVQTLMEDQSGNVWIGTLSGLACYDRQNLTKFDQEEGLLDLMILSLTEDRYGNIWIGTSGGGLYKYDRHKEDGVPISLFATDSLISSNNIFSMEFANDSTLLIGTEKGFDRIFLDENQQIQMVKSYDESNGFFGLENNLNALLRDHEGRFWFGTSSDLTMYDPRREQLNLKPPKAYITSIKIRHEERDWGQGPFESLPWFNLPVDPVFKWNENHLTLQYKGVTLSNPENIRYKYRLLGLNEEWSPPTLDDRVIYQDLRPGRYEFQVIAENENGIWIKTPASFSFQISPPLWKRWWFYLVLVSLFLVLLILYIRQREKQLVRRNRELETKVAERTKEISEQKEEIEAQRDEIEAQRDEIKAQRDIVISQKQAITDSIHYAQRIQRAVLPHDQYMQSFMPEYFIIYWPRDIVSGDFYWVRQLGEQLVIIAADCTGHGVPGAFMSMLGITLLNEESEQQSFSDAASILDRMRKKVKDSMAQEGKNEEQKDGMDMAVTIYHPTSRELQYAGAYNPLYLVRNKNLPEEDQFARTKRAEDETHVLFEIKGDRQPIGIYSIETRFTNHILQLREGDTFYIFSDGFVDQFGGENRKKYKAGNFKRLLLSIQGMDLNGQKGAIEEAYKSWKGIHEQLDDICIIGVKV
jgi:ligand-binding sensor domain-containing protein/serine phosphatase RsbU (regulator of sigma subunit)